MQFLGFYEGPSLICEKCGCHWTGGFSPLSGINRQAGTMCNDRPNGPGSECEGRLVLEAKERDRR